MFKLEFIIKKMDARPLDTIHDILRCLSFVQSLFKDQLSASGIDGLIWGQILDQISEPDQVIFISLLELDFSPWTSRFSAVPTAAFRAADTSRATWLPSPLTVGEFSTISGKKNSVWKYLRIKKFLKVKNFFALKIFLVENFWVRRRILKNGMQSVDTNLRHKNRHFKPL